jgi:hypothetical protein
MLMKFLVYRCLVIEFLIGVENAHPDLSVLFLVGDDIEACQKINTESKYDC